jgi:hypothetical protein
MTAALTPLAGTRSPTTFGSQEFPGVSGSHIEGAHGRGDEKEVVDVPNVIRSAYQAGRSGSTTRPYVDANTAGPDDLDDFGVVPITGNKYQFSATSLDVLDCCQNSLVVAVGARGNGIEAKLPPDLLFNAVEGPIATNPADRDTAGPEFVRETQYVEMSTAAGRIRRLVDPPVEDVVKVHNTRSEAG